MSYFAGKTNDLPHPALQTNYRTNTDTQNKYKIRNYIWAEYSSEGFHVIRRMFHYFRGMVRF